MASSNGIGSTTLEGLGVIQQDKTPNTALGSEDFLKLMVEQFKNQSPTDPADSSEFLGQLASFSTVSGIQDLQQSLSSIGANLQSSQALQASTMVGRSVLVPANTARYSGTGGVSGVIDIPEDVANLTIGIYNQAGFLVQELKKDRVRPGEFAFKWDGLDKAGVAAPKGNYTLRASAEMGEVNVAFPTLVQAKVESVTLLPNGGGAELNLAGFDSMDMAAVRRVI